MKNHFKFILLIVVASLIVGVSVFSIDKGQSPYEILQNSIDRLTLIKVSKADSTKDYGYVTPRQLRLAISNIDIPNSFDSTLIDWWRLDSKQDVIRNISDTSLYAKSAWVLNLTNKLTDTLRVLKDTLSSHTNKIESIQDSIAALRNDIASNLNTIDTIGLHYTQFAGKQATITNLADTAKYFKKVDTTGLHYTQFAGKQATITNLADTAKYFKKVDTTGLYTSIKSIIHDSLSTVVINTDGVTSGHVVVATNESTYTSAGKWLGSSTDTIPSRMDVLGLIGTYRGSSSDTTVVSTLYAMRKTIHDSLHSNYMDASTVTAGHLAKVSNDTTIVNGMLDVAAATDTAASRAYARSVGGGGAALDTTSLSNRINAKQNAGTYIIPSDTTLLSNRINGKQASGTYIIPSDTTLLSNRINGKQASGTYIVPSDTTLLSNRINGKQASGTYFGWSDTTSNIVSKSFGTNQYQGKGSYPTTATVSSIVHDTLRAQAYMDASAAAAGHILKAGTDSTVVNAGVYVGTATDTMATRADILAATGDTSRYAQTNNVNAFSYLNTGPGIPVSYILADTASTTSNTLGDVSGWSFSVVTGKSYRMEIIANYATWTLTTGIKLGVYALNSAVGYITGKMQGGIGNTAVATALEVPIYACAASAATGSMITTSGVGTTVTPTPLSGLMVFTCTTGGTVRVQMASEVNATGARLEKGSALIVTQLN